MLDSGKTSDPQFGVTVSPEGVVTVYPPPHGLRLDSETITEPTPVQINQVIGIGNDRFVLRPSDGLVVARTSASSDVMPMPAAAKGRAVDQQIIDWVASGRGQALRARWEGLVGPVQVHSRITDNSLFHLDSQHETFGHVLVGTADLPYSLPAELSNANKATVEHAEAAFGVMPNAPLAVDLAKTSLAIVGPRDRARAMATWLAMSLVASHSPADLSVETRAPADPGFWSWLDRFPHLDSEGSSALTVTISDERRAHAVCQNGVIGMLSTTADIPDEFGVVVEISDRSATFIDRNSGAKTHEVAVIGMANPVAVERSLMVSQHLVEAGDEAMA